MRPDDVRFASLADIPASNIDVRFAPNPARRKWDGVTVPFVTLEHHIFLDSVSQRAHVFGGDPVAGAEPPYASVPKHRAWCVFLSC